MRNRASKSLLIVGIGLLLLSALAGVPSLAAASADQAAQVCAEEQLYEPYGAGLPGGEAWESGTGALDSSAYDYCDGQGCGDPAITRVCVEDGTQTICESNACLDITHNDTQWAATEKWHAEPDPEAYRADHNCHDATHVEIYYVCSAAEEPTGSITINKSETNGAIPADWTFLVQDPQGTSYPVGSGQTLSDLPAGQYTITESGPPGWHLESVAGEGCAQDGQSVSAELVASGQAITCTLSNVLDTPSIAIEKSVSDNNATWHDADDPPGPDIIEFDPVFWSYAVTNTGNIVLTSVVVTDTVLGDICTIDSLAPSESQTCNAISFAVAGQQENLGSVTAQYAGSSVSDQDYCHYFGIGYIVPSPTPEPPTPTPGPPKKPTPVPVAPTATPVPPTPVATPPAVVEVLGVERLPAAGIGSPSWVLAGWWLRAIALLCVASGGILRSLGRRE